MQGETFWLLNGLMCLCAFLLGGKMAGLDIASRRGLFFASALGGLCALMNALLPSPLWLLPFPLGLRLCYGRRRPGDYLRAGLMVLSAMLLTGGSVQLLLRLAAKPGVAFFVTFGGGCFLWLLMRLNTLNPGDVRQIELRWQGRSLVLPAMADSGNLLRDVVTGLPVIVAPLRAACRLEPDLVDWHRSQTLPRGFRLMRVRTAAGSCLMPLFRPESCWLYLNGRRMETRAMVAVAGPEYRGVQALIPSAAFQDLPSADASPTLAQPT